MDSAFEKEFIIRVRQIADSHNIAPSNKTTDDKIIEIYNTVTSSFSNVSVEKGELLSKETLNTIAFKFFQVYEMFDEQHFLNHLEYELKKYKREGLRSDYRKNIKIF